MSLGRSELIRRCPTAHEQPVADRVADALVDDLEAVEVQQHDRDRLGVIGIGRGERVADPVGQQLAVGETGRRVVERATQRGIEQPRIVEGDRRELGEAHQGVRLARAERPIVRPRREPDHPDRRPAGGQRDADDRAESLGLEVGHTFGVRPVVVDDHGAPVRKTWPTSPWSTEMRRPSEVLEQAAAVADRERAVGLGQVDVAVRCAEQGGRPGQDGLEQDGRVVPVEQCEGGLIERPQVRVGL